MNVTEYIASGILESYVMGAISDQERREVECLSAIYPEVRNELDELSKAIENYALLHSLEPPAELKAKLMEQLDFNEQPPAIVRPMPIDRDSAPTYRSTWIVAASVGLLVLIFSFFLLSQLRNNQNTVASLRNANNSLVSEVKQLRDHQSQADQTLALLRQPGTRTLELKGNEKAPNGNVLVFWNARTRQVAVEVQSLPALPADQQYQLWSLVDGKPIDAGVFDATASGQPMQRLNRSIGRADAFAVTVEKRGGSPSPTLSTLLAMTPTSV
jgi:anti-sigma-K factor RskA